MISTQQLFINNIVANKSDNVVRLVYADWLDETDIKENIEFAKFIRMSIELWTMETELNFNLDLLKPTSTISLNKAVQNGDWCGKPLYCKNTHIPYFNMSKNLEENEKEYENWIKENKKLEPCKYHKIKSQLYAMPRIFYWLNSRTNKYFYVDGTLDKILDDIIIRRGFPYKIYISSRKWFRLAKKIVKIYPIEEVQLTGGTGLYGRYFNRLVDLVNINETNDLLVKYLSEDYPDIKFTIRE